MSTFGQTAKGPLWSGGFPSDYKSATKFTLNDTGKLNGISAYLRNLGISPQSLRAAIYADNAGVPGALVAQSDRVALDSGSTEGFVRFPFPGKPALSPNAYWLALLSGTLSSQVNVAYFSPGNGSAVYQYPTAAYLSGASNPFGTSTVEDPPREVSIYAEYEYVYEYNPDDWLTSLTRQLGKYLTDSLNDPDVTVEMDFPDTRDWSKQNPLDKALVHLAQDHIEDPAFGFGVPGVTVLDESDPINPTETVHEAALHLVNFDVGVWVSAEQGGATKRMMLVQALKNLLVPAGARQALQDATLGIEVISFDGGRNELDRINDVPVWRAMDMTLVVRVFSRHSPPTPTVVPTTLAQDPHLTISSDLGTPDDPTLPLVTP